MIRLMRGSARPLRSRDKLCRGITYPAARLPALTSSCKLPQQDSEPRRARINGTAASKHVIRRIRRRAILCNDRIVSVPESTVLAICAQHYQEAGGRRIEREEP